MRYINIGQMFGIFRWCDWCDMNAGLTILIVVGGIVTIICGCCIAITYARVAEEKEINAERAAARASRKVEDRANDAELAAVEESRKARFLQMHGEEESHKMFREKGIVQGIAGAQQHAGSHGIAMQSRFDGMPENVTPQFVTVMVQPQR